MTEEFLYYIWKYRLFTGPLYSVDQDEIEVVSPGFHNLNAGPDFSDARLRIGSTLWAGNVEIHLNTSDWFRHGHQHDKAYENVVLHVVYNHDMPGHESHIPVLEIKDSFNHVLFHRYRDFLSTRRWVPCINQVATVPEHEISLWLERMLIERIERKSEIIHLFLKLGNNNWEEALYYTLARSFGFSVNALPFEMMARSLPYNLLVRHRDNPMQLEALIMGQAGMLSTEWKDEWPQQLITEYHFLKKKYQLIAVDKHLWRFLRMRPGNFPTLRLAQFTSFIARTQSLLSRLIHCETIDQLTAVFSSITTSPYWETHYVFDKKATRSIKKMGAGAVNLLLINAVLPFLFVYGRAIDNDSLCNRVLDFYTKVPGEVNTITKNWKTAGLDVRSAFNTQALIGLKNDYCEYKRCLECRIGIYLIKAP
ncbi:hypothetical protein DSECCO2_546760 [anaerobic digester metagenome]|nr:DUF2851 family protein [Lentimicrobiaceae bacterium]